jgi:hypothetical protein
MVHRSDLFAAVKQKGRRLRPSNPKYTQAFDNAELLPQVQTKKDMRLLSPGTIQRNINILARIMWGCRGSCLAGWDIRRIRKNIHDENWALALYDSEDKLLPESKINETVRYEVRFKAGKTDGQKWSKPVRAWRIRPSMLLNSEVEHRSSYLKIERLDIINWIQAMLENKPGMSKIGRLKGYNSFTDLTQKNLTKWTSTDDEGTPKALGSEALNTQVKKALVSAGIMVRTDDEEVNPTHMSFRHFYAAHAIRGNTGSTIKDVWMEGFVSWPDNEHIRRLRHTEETFLKSYYRAVPERVLAQARRHPRRSELTPDEVLLL